MPRRLGILGGTFDPPHLGHLYLAQQALTHLQLDHVLWIPAGDPPHKRHQPVTAAHHRLALTRNLIADHKGHAVDLTDYQRPGPHYTSDTLRHLRLRFPQEQFWLLIGSDSLQSLPEWHAPEVVLSHCRLGVLRRAERPIDWARLRATLPQLEAKIDWITAPAMAVSATEIRSLLEDGSSAAAWLPPDLRTYIRENKLYRKGVWQER